MNYDFYITGISRIIYVGKYEYDEVTTSFETELKSNELIFHFSGDATVFFNDKILTTCENTIRYLPKGKPEKYIVFFRFLWYNDIIKENFRRYFYEWK